MVYTCCYAVWLSIIRNFKIYTIKSNLCLSFFYCIASDDWCRYIIATNCVDFFYIVTWLSECIFRLIAFTAYPFSVSCYTYIFCLNIRTDSLPVLCCFSTKVNSSRPIIFYSALSLSGSIVLLCEFYDDFPSVCHIFEHPLDYFLCILICIFKESIFV